MNNTNTVIDEEDRMRMTAERYVIRIYIVVICLNMVRIATFT